jgi:hypothetical protein
VSFFDEICAQLMQSTKFGLSRIVANESINININTGWSKRCHHEVVCAWVHLAAERPDQPERSNQPFRFLAMEIANYLLGGQLSEPKGHRRTTPRSREKLIIDAAAANLPHFPYSIEMWNAPTNKYLLGVPARWGTLTTYSGRRNLSFR